MYLFLNVLGLHCHLGFSLVVASGGYSLVHACGLLISEASLAACESLGKGFVCKYVGPELRLSSCGTRA